MLIERNGPRVLIHYIKNEVQLGLVSEFFSNSQ